MGSHTAPKILDSNVPRGAPLRGAAPADRSASWRRMMRRFRGGLKRIIIGDPSLYPESSRRVGADLRLIPDRIRRSGAYDSTASLGAPLGTFAGRPLIGTATPIHGGIILADSIAYALVIDEKYGFLEPVYRALSVSSAPPVDPSTRNELRIAAEVFSIVRSKLPLESTSLNELLAEKAFQQDEKVALDVFISARVGAPIHQAALAGYLIEKLIRCGRIGGSISLRLTAGREALTYTASNGNAACFEPGAID